MTEPPDEPLDLPHCVVCGKDTMNPQPGGFVCATCGTTSGNPNPESLHMAVLANPPEEEK